VSGAVSGPVRFLLNNPFERCTFDSIHVRVEIRAERTGLTLRNARLLDATVRPGERARVRAELESWRGQSRVVDFEVPIPEEAPDGPYTLFVGGGTELTRMEVQRLPGRFRATSLDDAWQRFAELHDSEGLYATLLAAAPEVNRRGDDYPELPISALALFGSEQVAGDLVRRNNTAILEALRVPQGQPLRGELLLTVTVDRKAP
jgi:hypothetical protein